MKNRLLASLALTFLSTLIPQLSIVFAQGSLTPPGAPAPTMKSLDQIEARTPISFAPFTITAPGSYYLTANLMVSSGTAINIATNGVTLDLNGFTIKSTAASATGYGIVLNGGLRNLTILNGFIEGVVTNNGSGVYAGSGFAGGIFYSGIVSIGVNTRVSGVSVAGCLNYGIYLGDGSSTVVEACTVRTVGSYGISASSIKGCLAVDCGGYGIVGDQVSDSRGECTGTSDGLFASYTAQNCFGTSGAGTGLHATTAQNCFGRSGTGTGLSANTAQNCYGASGSSPGISAETASNCYGFSTVNRGISANFAISCSGRCDAGGSYGLFATSVANTCYGYSYSGTGLSATIAIGCVGANISGPSVSYINHYNMPP
jgi:hypothetical protein